MVQAARGYVSTLGLVREGMHVCARVLPMETRKGEADREREGWGGWRCRWGHGFASVHLSGFFYAYVYIFFLFLFGCKSQNWTRLAFRSKHSPHDEALECVLL